MQRVKHISAWIVLLTSSSHVFCCVLPTIVGLVNVLANVGMFSIWVPQLEAWHAMMHGHEMNILIFSGVMLGIAAIVDMISIQIDCHSTGCTHGSCEPSKDRAAIILLIATVLFAFNTASYFFAHHLTDPAAITTTHQTDEPHDHEHAG